MDSSLAHFQAELSRIDVLLRRAVMRWQLAGQDPADAFRGLYVSDEGAEALLARPLCVHWGETATLEPQEERAFSKALEQAEKQARALANAARSQGHVTRLDRLVRAFGLERFELEVLLICLAPCLDQRYEKIYGYLQDDITRKRPSVNLILDLLCETGLTRSRFLAYFADQSPLFRYALIEKVPEPGRQPLLSYSLAVNETVAAWLLGTYGPDRELGSHTVLTSPERHPVYELLAGEALKKIQDAIEKDSLLAFYGSDELSQEAAARLLAARWEQPLLRVDLAKLAETGLEPSLALRRVFRDARLNEAVPFIKGWDVCLEDSAPRNDILTELYAYPGAVILSGCLPWQPRGMERRRRILWLEFPVPAYSQRLALWAHFIGDGKRNEGLGISSLAGQFQLDSGQIRDAVASAHDMANQWKRPLERADLFAAARAYSNPRLAGLARKITPRYGWEDIVLPEDQIAQLCEIVATVRGRPLVLDEWGLGRKLVSSRGVTALFAGPPGTGKTMAAEVIAAELGLDLYKIDLSTVVSKYIGETEKNLERIFAEAESSNAILFFDEADALFGKRSEVRDSHDRYANIEISYLLQRMESYNGVSILATNLRANLDEAFTRRLGFSVDFPFPDEAARLRIWKTLFPPEVPRVPELDFAALARRFKLAGGNIRNIIVGAAYLSAADGQCVTMEHLLHGARRELQKMGRLIGEQDLTYEQRST